MTFESAFRLQIPNLTVRSMFVDYYDELSEFTNEDVARRHFIGAAEDRAEPDAETLAQARRYRDSLPSRPGWDHAVETAVVEVYGDLGYRWFPVAD